jgi:hypothetical protein
MKRRDFLIASLLAPLAKDIDIKPKEQKNEIEPVEFLCIKYANGSVKWIPLF